MGVDNPDAPCPARRSNLDLSDPGKLVSARLRHHCLRLGDMKRLLFLDFDGVLHPVVAKPGQSLPFEWLPVLTALLSGARDVAIVVHSSWAETFPLDELREFLGPLGCRLVGAVHSGPKASSILLFLRSTPEVEDWLVIDDEPGEFPKDFPGPVVICDRARGISDPSVQAEVRGWLSNANRSGPQATP